MNVFIESHQQLLKCLLQHKVNFLLVGGYAVIYHGYKRTTGDMDLWIEPTNQNKTNLIEALKTFEFNADDIKYISQLDFTKHLAFHFWEEPERVDCITYVSNVSFPEAFASKIVADIEGVLVPVIQYQHLIQSKDKADVEELQKINRHKTDNG